MVIYTFCRFDYEYQVITEMQTSLVDFQKQYLLFFYEGVYVLFN